MFDEQKQSKTFLSNLLSFVLIQRISWKKKIQKVVKLNWINTSSIKVFFLRFFSPDAWNTGDKTEQSSPTPTAPERTSSDLIFFSFFVVLTLDNAQSLPVDTNDQTHAYNLGKLMENRETAGRIYRKEANYHKTTETSRFLQRKMTVRLLQFTQDTWVFLEVSRFSWLQPTLNSVTAAWANRLTERKAVNWNAGKDYGIQGGNPVWRVDKQQRQTKCNGLSEMTTKKSSVETLKHVYGRNQTVQIEVENVF